MNKTFAKCGDGSQSGSNFIRVSSDRLCPICGKADWCGIHKSGAYVVCARVPSNKPAGVAGWKHWLDQPLPELPPPDAASKLPTADVCARVGEFLAAVKPDQLYDLAHELGVRWESLDRLDVGWHESVGCYTFPMRNARGQYCGVRYRFPNGDKRSLKGGREGVFVPHATIGGRQLFVAEGPTDTAALLDCGFMAIGRPNCSGGVEIIAEIVRTYRPRHVVIVADQGVPGLEGAASLAAALARCSRVTTIVPVTGKDARECVRNGGRRQSILDVLDSGVNEFWRVVPWTPVAT